ncbi:MAG: TRAP transporter large permease [Vibrio sp.]|uniref:TRAP transporter large permease n=1 Tax=Vibrio sp. TaxID=678 RepID=UPI003A85864E
MTVAILVGIWLIAIFLGIPVGVALLGISLGYFVYTGASLSFALNHIIGGIDSFSLLAVPLFILTGNLLNSGGITDRLFGFARTLVGHRPGGLGHVNVLASLFFSGMSGSAMADTGGLGKLEIKAMRDAGYDDDFSCSVTAASSIIGPLVPPSITMVLYGVVTNTSIGALFLGGVLPGVLCTAALMVMVHRYAIKNNYPTDKKSTCAEKWQSLKKSFSVLLTPFIIIGGLFSGFFSPTEAAAITVFYALVIDRIQYHELTWKKLWDSLYETATVTSSISVIITGVSLFGYIVAREQAPQQIVNLFLGMTESPIIFMFIVCFVLFILGSFIESLAIMMMVIPILAPVAAHYGIDSIHFGVVVVLNLMISTLTPPMGMALFVVSKVAEVDFGRIMKSIWPWLVPPTVVLILTVLIPQIATLLPSLL